MRISRRSSLELEALREQPQRPQPPKDKPRRTALPAHLPRREVRHEPENTVCSCGCQLERIGEDVSEKLDYMPGSFQVERHVRGKWVCRSCETAHPGARSRADHRQGDPDARGFWLTCW